MNNKNQSSLDLIDTVQRETINKILKEGSSKLENEAKERKKKFFQEIIHVRLKYGGAGDTSDVEHEYEYKDDYDYKIQNTNHDKNLQNGQSNNKYNDGQNNKNQKEKAWHIPRFRLTKDFVQQLVDRLVHNTHEAGSIIAYLRESETGEVIIPEDMQKLCRSSSSISYELFVSHPKKTIDVTEAKNDCYRGGMKFLLLNVPLHSQNTIHQVKSIHIRNWIMDGILCEEPSIQQMQKKIIAIQRNIDNTENRMKKIVDEPMFNEKGYELSGKRAQQKREEKYILLQRDKDKFYNELEAMSQELSQSKKKIISKIYLSIQQHDDMTTWEFLFVGEDREYFDKIILKKKNWNTSYMYAQSSIDLLSYEQSKSWNDYLIDSAGIKIKRLEDGFGCYHRRNSLSLDKMRGYNSHIDAYHGSYQDGNKSGHGILYTKASVYGGEIENNQPCGRGTLITNDGDIWTGSFTIESSSNLNPYLQKKRYNRYARSKPSGHHEIRFSDGSFYSGTINNGEITGHGVYVSSKGDRMEGNFIKGSLIKGTKVQFDGDIKMEGEFTEDGLLIGEGSVECASIRSLFNGYFIDGLYHGIGEEVIFNRKGVMCSKYKGMFSNGKRSGLGKFEFHDIGFKRSESVPLEKDRLQLYGYWHCGQPKSGGLITKDISSFAIPTTVYPSSRFRWLHRFKKVQDNKERELRSRNKQMTEYDNQFRNVIEMRKKSLFDNHRQSILSTLLSGDQPVDKKSSGKGENQKDNADIYNGILPSKTKYFKQRKYNKGPRTLNEALNLSTSGLCMVDSFDDIKQGVFRTMMDEMKRRWLEGGMELFQSVDMSMIEEEYRCLDEEWSIINVNQIEEIIKQRTEK